MQQPVVVCGDVRFTYREFGDRCRAVGSVLDAYQTKPGDRIGVLCANSIAFLDLYVGVPAHGRIVVPLNTRWAEPELRYALRDAGVRVLFTDRDPGALSDAVEHVVRTDLEYEQLLADAPPVAPATLSSSSVAGVFYTGGTTGAAKGVMLTHGNLAANAAAMRDLAPVDADDVFLVMAPMFHAAGTTSVRYCIDAGVSQVIVPFDPAVVLDAIEREQVTHTLAVPTMLAALVDEQEVRPRNVSSLRVLLHGASAITPALVHRAVDSFPAAELVHLYGTTETSPIVTALHDTTSSASVGRPVRCHVWIRDAIDGVGEVCVRGPNVMAGYWHKPDATAKVLHDGWYRTGDIGRFGDDGQLYLLDRKDDVIITGAENVYPSEVEAVLCAHPAVAEAAVYGMQDARWGEIVHAAVVIRHDVAESDLIEHCKRRIASYKVPRAVTFVDALPRSGAGKVLRRELRQ